MHRTTWTLLVVSLVFSAPFLVGQDDVLAKARKAHAAQDYQTAVNLLEENYDAIRREAEALQILAEGYSRLGDSSRSIDYAQKALELDESDLRSLQVAVEAFHLRGIQVQSEPGTTTGRVHSLFEGAIEYADKYLAKKADGAAVLALKGQCLWGLQKFVESAAAFEAAFKVEAKNSDHAFFASRSYRQAKKPDEALTIIDKGIKAQPGKGWLYLEKGHAWFGKGTPESKLKAAACYGQALCAAEVDQQTANEAPRAIYGVLSPDKKWAEAAGLMETWIASAPKNSVAHWWLGWYRTQLQKDTEALQAFSKSWELSGGTRGAAAFQAGMAEARRANMDAAGAWMVKAEKAFGGGTDPNSGPVAQIQIIANSMHQKGKVEEAIAYLEKYGIGADPGNWRVLNNLGFWLRDFGGARGRGAKGKALCAKSAKYYEQAATAISNDANASNSNKAQVWNDTGVLFHWPQYQIDDVAKGMKYYKKALEYDPSYTDALENLGLVMNKLGRYEEAVSLFERVLAKPNMRGRMVSRRGLATAKKALGKDG